MTIPIPFGFSSPNCMSTERLITKEISWNNAIKKPFETCASRRVFYRRLLVMTSCFAVSSCAPFWIRKFPIRTSSWFLRFDTKTKGSDNPSEPFLSHLIQNYSIRVILWITISRNASPMCIQHIYNQGDYRRRSRQQVEWQASCLTCFYLLGEKVSPVTSDRANLHMVFTTIFRFTDQAAPAVVFVHVARTNIPN